jgi:hypothetical protein
MLVTFVLARVGFVTSSSEKYATAQHEFVFDQQDDTTIANMIIRAVRRTQGRISSVVFADSKVVVPLQAADMVAWATRRRLQYPVGEPNRIFRGIERMSDARIITRQEIESSCGDLIKSVIDELSATEEP